MHGDGRLRAIYVLAGCADASSADELAGEIAREQTVELPAACLGPEIVTGTVGQVERIQQFRETHFEAVISYDAALAGDEIPQTLNLLFGNISLKRGIVLREIAWPPTLLHAFPGPRHGIAGLRRLCAAEAARPLLCTALKPLGQSVDELASTAGHFARGGIDIIKDDHGLADQATAPFDERVRRCQQAVERANATTGGRSLYFPNVTASADRLAHRLELAHSVGCRGVLIAPWLVGLDAVVRIARASGMAILAHPSLSGVFFHPDHGIAPEVLLGQLFRLIGADGVIYPNTGGRFPFPAESCDRVNEALRGPLGRHAPALPVPAGGIDADDTPRWVKRYGPDTCFLIGGSLYAQGDLERAAARLVAALR